MERSESSSDGEASDDGFGQLAHAECKAKADTAKPRISKKDGLADGETSYKSQHGALKRKAQRHRRQEKRRQLLDGMSKDERAAFLAEEKIALAQQAAAVKAKLEAGKAKGRRIVIDCEFEAKMSDRENKSLIAQLKYIYSKMKKSPVPVSLTLTGYGGRLEELIKYHNAEQWEMHWEPRTLAALLADGMLEKEKTVYLSPDASDVVSQIDTDTVYIIGGLVDGSVLKDVSKSKAAELGVRTQKLDLAAFKGNCSFRNCLNVNDVFNILVESMEGKPLADAVQANMPLRMKASK